MTLFAAGFSFQFARVCAWRGQKDETLHGLDKACEYRDAGMLRLRVDPTLAVLHGDPRFEALVKAIGVPG